ncbi:UTRA domain-containing protein [Acidiphilium sp. AL]|uniref:UTRA domain-containing protein n=1 Tax=Acidiphilium sp. AL TaxID=2871704 RepID=UPI0021CB2221|nr:UTRA domain-containing protein [Acidiphilium sp. AL]MCU4161677.1 UTRA domain-containing protein [Acidiphilium sp. AL]
MTVNKAISTLTAAGLIVRRRRAGSFVASPPVQSAVLQIPDMQSEITSRGEVYGYELISRRYRDSLGKVGNERNFLLDTSLLVLKCRHLANSRPFALEERFISLDVVPEAAEVDFSTTPPSTWLVAQVPWTRAEHNISAVNATAGVADDLAIPKGAACLVVERRTWRVADEITYVRQTFPGKAYRLIAHFSP